MVTGPNRADLSKNVLNRKGPCKTDPIRIGLRLNGPNRVGRSMTGRSKTVHAKIAARAGLPRTGRPRGQALPSATSARTGGWADPPTSVRVERRVRVETPGKEVQPEQGRHGQGIVARVRPVRREQGQNLSTVRPMPAPARRQGPSRIRELYGPKHARTIKRARQGINLGLRINQNNRPSRALKSRRQKAALISATPLPNMPNKGCGRAAPVKKVRPNPRSAYKGPPNQLRKSQSCWASLQPCRNWL